MYITTGGQVDLSECFVRGSLITESGTIGDIFATIGGTGGAFRGAGDLSFENGTICSNADEAGSFDGFLDDDGGAGTWEVSCEDGSFDSSGSWAVF